MPAMTASDRIQHAQEALLDALEDGSLPADVLVAVAEALTSVVRAATLCEVRATSSQPRGAA